MNLRFKTFPFLGLLAFIFASFTHAQAVKTIADCEAKSKNTYELSLCLSQLKNTVDSQLKIWVNNQLFNLEAHAKENGRTTALNIFKQSQQKFELYRETDCRWQYLVMSPDSRAATYYNKCYIQLTQDRINQLEMFNK